MACRGFSTCYGYGCGGGAVEQTAVGYSDYPMTTTGDSGRGPHPKCQIPPETFSFEIGGWHGSLEMVGAMGELDRINVGCQHSNCSCPDPKCKCMRTDMAGNTNFQGHMQTKDCLDQGHCINPDMTVTGCCEDPITGVKPNVKTGFGTGLNQDECACRGGTWSSWCDPWTQDELDTCNKCKSSCPPYKIGNSIGLGFTYSQGCLQAPVKIDADGNRCCCSGDSPICDSCPNHCVVWQGHTENTCGPPVLYCDEDSCGPERKRDNLGYGITIPWEVTLVCIAPAKTAHGHLQDPPDYGSWLLHVVAWRPDPDNALGTELCQQWTFGNKHGVASNDGFLDLGSACVDGSWTISVDIPVQPDEIKTGCSCSCPCQEQITNITSGEECDCFKPDCVTDGFECLDGTKAPPDCDASCLEPIPACPAADALWAGLQVPHQYCNDGQGDKPELMGAIDNLCGPCCKTCNEFCEDQCVCEEAQAKVGPSSICGIKTGSNRNIDGHGCSKDPKPSYPGSTSTPKEGDCCNHHYGTPTGEKSLHTDCIWESYYECGCLSEDQANGGTIQLIIQANAQGGSTITQLSHYEDQDGNSGAGLGFTPVGSDTPGIIINECGAVDAICDLSLKHPDTDGCRYTKWPDPSCVTPLPPPDHTGGVRCPNSLVWEQPTYGYQCTLPGGSNNGAMAADFPVKPGLCLNARPERWHLRPQFTHPHLWAICHKPGPGEPAPPCDQPADMDAECVEHPEVTRFVADIGNIHGTIGECNIYCEGWWEVVVDCFRAWTLDLCEACLGDCWTDAKIVGAKPWCCGHCDEGDHSSDWGCDGKWPGIFPFLYYHPPEDIFCPYGEYFPAISCPTVPNSPAATMLGQSGQLYYPGNITKKWTSCCGNQPAGCECCYPCGHPAYDPTCRIRNLISGNICDICWECMCTSSKSEGGSANQVYMSNDCPNGCQQPAGEPTGQCIQVVQDGGGEVAGCGQFMQEMGDIPETCPAPIYCPEGLIPYNKYGGGYCHEGDFCCQCLREKSHWLAVPATRRIGPTTNQLGWKLGAPVLYDMAWYPLKEAVCILEPCGMGESGEGEQPGGGPGEPPVLYDKGSIKVSVTLMREGTSTEVGEALKIHDHQSTGEIIGVTGKGQPVKITSRIQVGQLEINLAPGDPVFIGIMNDTQGKPFGSKVGGNNAANGQFVVLAVSGNEFTIALPGGGPVIGDGDWTDGGTWHYYDPNDAGASCTGPHQQCAYSFEFDQGGVNVGTSPKVLPEALFIECVEEAFVEWSNILESLWSPRADYTATGRRHGSWASGGSSPSDPQHPFPGRHNINPGLTPQGSPGPQANSHQLRARFINLGHEPAISNEVPSNKVDRYNVAEWSRATNYPLVGRCVTRLPGGDTAGGVVPERRWENMASCITNGHCYAKGCSANDMRATSVQLSSSNKCEEMAHAASGTSYDNPKDCLSTKYYACLTHPKIEVLRWISGEAFGDPVDSDADGDADLFPDVPLRWYLDPKYVREDIGDEDCCNHVDGYWEEIEGDWSSDFGNGQGIFNPGFSELFPCVPKSAECCQGTVSCVSPAGDHFLTPTNTYVPSSCCKEYEQKYGQCLGDYNLDGIMDEMAGCDYDCCGFGLAGWCVDKNDPNNIYWSTASCPGCGGKDTCDKGSGAALQGCTETLSVCGDGKPTTAGTDAQTCAPLRWQQTQRVLKNDLGTAGSFEIALRFPGSNIGDPLERTDCDLTDSLLFAVGDFIKIGNEYMEVTSSNLTTNKLSVTRGVGGFGADPSSSFRTGHSAGDSIYLWLNDTPGTENCDDVAHCVDNDGYLIGDANEGIGYFPIDNRSLYHLCRDGDRRSVYSDACGIGGSCWIAGEAGTGSSRGVPIGISSLYDSVSSSDTIITITEIDNTGNLFVDDGNDVHNPSIIATPEKFKLKTGDIIRIEAENMEVVAVRKTSEFHASVKGDCTADVKLLGLYGAPTTDVPECEFIDCDGGDRQTDCRHWYRKDHDQAIGWSNCIGAPLGDIEWPDKIVSLYEITVRRGEDGTSAVDHDANKWVRKKYGNVINDCRQCEDNLMGTAYRHEWVGGTGITGPTNPAGSIWRRARWYPKFDWTANIWEAKVSLDTPFYGKTGGECLEWPEKDDCCPRIGQVRVGMVNWYDALRERWANEGKGQCYDCNTGVIIGNQTTFGPNSVELHGECLRYNEDRYNKLLIGSTSDSQDDCLDLNCKQPLNSCGGVCINSQNQEITTYTTEEDCISNNLIWATWTWSAYVNKDVCNNAGHCWDYRDPPLVPASGNPFACGYMGGMRCMRQLPDGVWVSCLPRAGAPYGKANNMIGVDRDLELMYPELGKNCVGFRPQVGGNVIPAQPGGGDPPDAPDTGGEPCRCITEGKEGIAGDLYIDSSVKWRPDWVPEYDKPGAYSIKRVLMKQIGHMLGLPAGQDVMGPITGPADDAVPIGRSTYNKLVEMYEPRWWNRGGRNDYWWVSGVYAGDFK